MLGHTIVLRSSSQYGSNTGVLPEVMSFYRVPCWPFISSLRFVMISLGVSGGVMELSGWKSYRIRFIYIAGFRGAVR